MKYSRVLTGPIKTFFTVPSPMREKIVDYVRENLSKGTRSVALCFRGNAATLYYRCHRLLRIRSSREGLVGEFDFRHARFSQHYSEALARLEALHAETSRVFEGGGGAQTVVFPMAQCGPEGAVEALELFRGLIDDFFDPEKTEYAFGAPAKGHGKASYSEKQRQQQLWASYFLHDGLLYYDLEYSERAAAQNGVHGRFDLLGLRREQGGYTLLFTELKSTPQAIGGRSGVGSHERDSLRYLESPLLSARKEEACETVRLLSDIFQRPYPEDLTPQTVTGARVQFVFSDAAVAAGQRYRPADSRVEKAYFEDGAIKRYGDRTP